MSQWKRGDRGQVLPLWAAAFVVSLGLMFLVLNYGNEIRWQVRAQNAADAAANAAIGLQAQRFNLDMELLYGLNVEDFRARRLLDGMLLAINESGGCTSSTSNLGSQAFGTCGYVYAKLRPAFIRAAYRDNQTLQYFQRVTANQGLSQLESDIPILLTSLQTNCNAPNTPIASYNPAGGDCSFYYSIAPTGVGVRTGIKSTSEDAENIFIPSFGNTDPNIPNDSESSSWAPLEIDIVTCAVIPPIVPTFGMFHFPTVYAVGRGAATDVPIEQDWLQPGALVDPFHSGATADFQYFQPIEDYVDLPPNHDFTQYCTTTNSTTCMQSTANPDWYNVNFGGNATTASGSGFYSPLSEPELSVRVAWWGPIAIKPFGGSPVLNSTTCHP